MHEKEKSKQSEQDLIDGSELFSEQEVKEQLNKLHQSRTEIIEYKQQGSALRSRQMWLEQGEKNSCLFSQAREEKL